MTVSHFIYNDTEPRRQGMRNPIPYENWDAPKHWLTHYYNHKYLVFITLHASTTFKEKQQAHKELTICQRKLTFWAKHPNWSVERIETQRNEIDRQWSQPQHK